jgi:hypothetical protein
MSTVVVIINAKRRKCYILQCTVLLYNPSSEVKKRIIMDCTDKQDACLVSLLLFCSQERNQVKKVMILMIGNLKRKRKTELRDASYKVPQNLCWNTHLNLK